MVPGAIPDLDLYTEQEKNNGTDLDVKGDLGVDAAADTSRLRGIFTGIFSQC